MRGRLSNRRLSVSIGSCGKEIAKSLDHPLTCTDNAWYRHATNGYVDIHKCSIGERKIICGGMSPPGGRRRGGNRGRNCHGRPEALYGRLAAWQRPRRPGRPRRPQRASQGRTEALSPPRAAGGGQWVRSRAYAHACARHAHTGARESRKRFCRVSLRIHAHAVCVCVSAPQTRPGGLPRAGSREACARPCTRTRARVRHARSRAYMCAQARA